MSDCALFRKQIASIMEYLAKAAASQITQIFEEGSVVLRLEVSRSHEEIDSLRRKLQQVESELWKAREAPGRDSRSVGVQVNQSSMVQRSQQSIRGGAEGAADAGERRHFQEGLEEKNCDLKAQDTWPVLGFSVKAEREEEGAAQRLCQTGCEHGTGKISLGSEYVMYERDDQPWASFTRGDSDVLWVDPVCSQNLSAHTHLQDSPAMVVPGCPLSSFGKDMHVADVGLVKEETYTGHCAHSEANRSEMDGTQYAEDQQLQQPLNCQTGVSGSIANEVSNASKETRIPWRSGRGRNPYGCTECKKNFFRFFELKRHHLVHTGEKPFSCAQCGKCFSLESSLLNHKRTHSPSKPFICGECGKGFNHSSGLLSHETTHSGRKPFVCAHCGKAFSRKGNALQHEKTHSGIKPFGCEDCGKRFSQESVLRLHRRIHTGEKPFVCTQCGKGFTVRSYLVAHEMTHSGNKPFVCAQCGKAFGTRNILISHERVHGGKKYGCEECGKKFYRRSHLKLHSRIHSRERPFHCTECGKGFSESRSLMRHQKVHNQE